MRKLTKPQLKKLIIQQCIEELKAYHVDTSKYKTEFVFSKNDVTETVYFTDKVNKGLEISVHEIYFSETTGEILERGLSF